MKALIFRRSLGISVASSGPDRATDRPDQHHEKEDRRDRQGRRDIPPPADDAGHGLDQRPRRRDFAPQMDRLKRGRNFAVRLGLVPRHG